MNNPDFTFSHGSIVLVHPRTEEARAHLHENVADGSLFMGDAVVCEHRAAAPLAEALNNNGWRV